VSAGRRLWNNLALPFDLITERSVGSYYTHTSRLD